MCQLTSRIEFPDIIPSLPKSEGWIKFKSPQLDTTCKHRSIVFGEHLGREGLLERNSVKSLSEVMQRRKWNFINPGFPFF